MKTQPITQEYLIHRLIRVIEKVEDVDYKLKKIDYIILRVSFFRLKDNGVTSKVNFLRLVKAYRADYPVMDDFLISQINLFKGYIK